MSLAWTNSISWCGYFTLWKQTVHSGQTQRCALPPPLSFDRTMLSIWIQWCCFFPSPSLFEYCKHLFPTLFQMDSLFLILEMQVLCLVCSSCDGSWWAIGSSAAELALRVSCPLGYCIPIEPFGVGGSQDPTDFTHTRVFSSSRPAAFLQVVTQHSLWVPCVIHQTPAGHLSYIW